MIQVTARLSSMYGGATFMHVPDLWHRNSLDRSLLENEFTYVFALTYIKLFSFLRIQTCHPPLIVHPPGGRFCVESLFLSQSAADIVPRFCHPDFSEMSLEMGISET